MADTLEGDLTDIIAQAEDFVERYIDRTLVETTYTEVVRPNGSLLFLRNYPIIELLSVETRSSSLSAWATQDLSSFELDRNGDTGVVESTRRSVAGQEVKVTYTAGYDPIPWDIKAAVILQSVVFSYQDLEVYGAGDSKKPGVLYLQDDVLRMLKPYRRKQIY